MAEPKKPAGATAEAGPEEPTRYIEQQPMGAEGGEEYVPSFDYMGPEEDIPEEELGGKGFDYMAVEEEIAEEELGGKGFDYLSPSA